MRFLRDAWVRPRLVLLVGLDIPMIERAGRCDALEFLRWQVESGARQQHADGGAIGLAHRFLAGIGAQRSDLPMDINDGFVKRVAEPGGGVAADYYAARLRHKTGDVPDAATDHN